MNTFWFKKFAIFFLVIAIIITAAESWPIISWINYMLSGLIEPRSPYFTESYAYDRIYHDGVIPLITFLVPLAFSIFFYWKKRYQMSIGFALASILLTFYWYSLFSMQF